MVELWAREVVGGCRDTVSTGSQLGVVVLQRILAVGRHFLAVPGLVPPAVAAGLALVPGRAADGGGTQAVAQPGLEGQRLRPFTAAGHGVCVVRLGNCHAVSFRTRRFTLTAGLVLNIGSRN